MRTTAFCPINNKKINERIARVNGIITVTFLVSLPFIPSFVPAFLLAVDFLLRASNFAKYSPIRYISERIVKLFKLNVVYINAGPKQFAARIGFVFSVMISAFFLFHLFTAAYVFIAVLLLCSFLEGFFGFCIACEIYPYVYKLFYKDSLVVRI